MSPPAPPRAEKRPGTTAVGGLTGLLVGLVVLGPVLAPGFLLIYDMVFVPEPNFGARTFGLDGSVPRAVPNDLVVSVLTLLMPGWVVQKLLLLAVFVLVGAGIGALVRSRTAAVAGALAATWNPYVAERLALGHWAFLLGYALLPWVAHGAVAVVRGDRFAARRLTLWLLAAGLCGSTAAVMAGLTAAAVLLAPLGGAVAAGARVRGLVVLGLVTVLVNAAWWLPALLIPGRLAADPQGVTAFAARPDTPLGLAASLLTGGGIWHQRLWPPERFSVLLVGASLVAVLVCTAWLLARRRQAYDVTPGLLVAGLVGLVLAAAGSSPIAEAATAFVTNVPGGGLIRDGHKFLAPWIVFVALAVGSVVDDLRARLAAPRAGTVTGVRHTLVMLLLAALLWPVVTLPSLALGSHRGWGAAEYPAAFLVAAEHVDARDGAVASFPWTLYRRYDWNRNDVVLDPWSRLVEARVLVNDDLPLSEVSIQGEDRAADRVDEALASGSEDEVVATLAALGVRFVVFHRDQPTSEAEEPLFEGQRVVLADRRLALYDLGPAPEPNGPLPGWAWVGMAMSGATAGAILVVNGLAGVGRPGFIAHPRVRRYSEPEGRDST